MILDDIKRLVGLLEEWQRFEDSAHYPLTDWLIAASCGPGREPSAQDVIDELGALGMKLHHILRAGASDTGHVRPPTR